MRVQVVDPSAFTPPYDHALCAALARAGAAAELVTSPFAYGTVPAPDGYVRRELFYRRAWGPAGSRRRRAVKLASHVPDMLRLRAQARAADVVHFQWLDVPWLDVGLLPDRPRVLTAHDLLPREPRPGQVRAQRALLRRMDAVIVHSDYGRRALLDGGVTSAERVHVVPHGAFEHLARLPEAPLPPELAGGEGPVVLFFGLLRAYKGVETLLRAWQGVGAGELWIVGRPMMELSVRGDRVRFLPRFVADAELAAVFRAADVVVLPYTRTERFDFSGVLATALAFGVPAVLSDIGGFSEVAATGAARLVPPGDVEALRAALVSLVGDGAARRAMAAAARAAASGEYSWDAAAARTLAVYRGIV